MRSMRQGNKGLGVSAEEELSVCAGTPPREGGREGAWEEGASGPGCVSLLAAAVSVRDR